MTQNKVTIENNCTVIRKPFDAEWVKEQLSMGIFITAQTKAGTNKSIHSYCDRSKMFLSNNMSAVDGVWLYTVSILPPLPRHPKPEDASLLYRYMAEGLVPVSEYFNPMFEEVEECDSVGSLGHDAAITHATLNGERVEVAINDKE